ncbi:HK97 gp10 family phage protein [Pseudomonas prosekii]|uniref:HK97 gp10 family phage protein n=1 Tax=Pseudomonas prosekii TaxID=1148509 RepID=A0A1H2B3R7_9PSED|nr:HK97 gp10 family phage protein [Pseudomonas prosekii]SDT52742.1 hypothetical protein SAMN05216222_4895 [Pseudomonas prosekii]
MAQGWSVPPSLFMDEVEEVIKERIRAIATALHGEIVSRSPVDTGRFRRNNVISIGAPVFTITEEVDKDGAETKADGVAALSALKPYTVVYIQNNLPYGERLENGHSGQAPAGIYGITFIGVSEDFR